MATTLLADGIWTWFNSPEILHDSAANCLYIGTTTTKGFFELSRLNLETGQVHRVDNPTDSLEHGRDDHNNCGAIKLASGEIMAGYSSHGNADSAVRVSSDAPANPWAWDARVLTLDRTDLDENQSYSQLVQVEDDTDTIYYFYRRALEDQCFRTSEDNGATWSDGPEGTGTQDVLFSVTGERPYFRYWRTSGTRIDCVCTNGHPNETTTSLYHFYIEIDPTDGSREYYQSDGTLIGDDTDLPLGTGDVTQVYNGSTSEAWNWDLKMIGSTLTVAFAVFPSHGTSSHEYWRGTLTSGTWSTEKICDAGTSGTEDYLYSGQVHYSGGIALDPNNVDKVYVSREYGAGDFRVEEWTKSGTWSKTADLSGDTGSVNARPRTVSISGTTEVFWWSGTYTAYGDFATSIVSTLSFTHQCTAKPASPVWTSAEAPPGIQAYYSIHEGTGAPADATGTYGTTQVGSPTWDDDSTDYDPHVETLSTSNYFTANSLATAFTSGGYTKWLALLYSITDTSAGLKLGIAFGNSSSTNPIFGIGHNGNAPTVYYRANTGTQTNFQLPGGAIHADGAVHCLIARLDSGGLLTLQSDLGQRNQGTVGSLTVDFDRFAIGCLLRNTAGSAFPGKILAAGVGWGTAAPEPSVLINDWMDKQFSGLTPVGGGVSVPVLGLTGGLHQMSGGIA